MEDLYRRRDLLTHLGHLTWLDAQHQYMAIAQQAPQRAALHAMAAMAATAATRRTRHRPTPRASVGVAVAAAAGPAAAHGRDGREPAR